MDALRSEERRRKAEAHSAHDQRQTMGEAAWKDDVRFQAEYARIRKDAEDYQTVWTVVRSAFADIRGIRAMRVQSGALGAAVSCTGINVFDIFPAPGEYAFSDDDSESSDSETDSSSV